MSVQPQPGDMVIVGDVRYRITVAWWRTVQLRSWHGHSARAPIDWLEPEPELSGFRRAWRSHRCIPTR